MTMYVALVRKEPGSAWGVDFPDFPGCISSGATLPAALRSAKGALVLHVKGMIEDGDQIPPSSTADVITKSMLSEGAHQFKVSLPPMIIGARIRQEGFQHVAVVILVSGITKRLFCFYDDEITFTGEELIGLTVDEALKLRHDRDVAYLQS